jgi:pimeloyl-ACP methyl ester carboxylesterase
MTEFTTTSRGDRVAFDRFGEGPGLVFVAGAGPDRASDPITAETARRVAEEGITTVVFDRLGRGESRTDAGEDSGTGTGGGFDLDRELEAVRAAIDAAGGSAVLCGHSSGCSIALRAAVAGLPVTGLVLWEAPLAQSSVFVREWIDEFERRLDAADLAGAQEQYMRDMPPEWLAGAKASPVWDAIVAGAPTLRPDGQSLVWASEALEATALASIRMPVLAAYGTSTLPEMPLAATRIVAAIPGATVEAVPGAHHSWEPEPMAAVLARFVRSTAAAA